MEQVERRAIEFIRNRLTDAMSVLLDEKRLDVQRALLHLHQAMAVMAVVFPPEEREGGGAG